jgi:hypothetical protein
MDKIIEKLNKLEAELNNYKTYTESVILVNTTLIQEIANGIDVKLDILCNLDNSNTSANKTQVKKSKALLKSAFFKNKLKENINEYVNILYTEDEIKDLYSNDEVKVKKTETLKKNKIIDLLYVNITKHDAQKNTKLKNIYNEYKLEFEKDESVDGGDEEETKSNN